MRVNVKRIRLCIEGVFVPLLATPCLLNYCRRKFGIESEFLPLVTFSASSFPPLSLSLTLARSLSLSRSLSILFSFCLSPSVGVSLFSPYVSRHAPYITVRRFSTHAKNCSSAQSTQKNSPIPKSIDSRLSAKLCKISIQMRAHHLLHYNPFHAVLERAIRLRLVRQMHKNRI